MTLLTHVQRWWGRTAEASPPDPDSQLMWRYRRSGHPDLLAELMQRLGDDLYHYLLTQTDPALADDLFQSVWLRVIERRHQYEPGDARFKTWLFTLGRNLMLDELRRQRRWSSETWSDAHEGSGEPLEAVVEVTELAEAFDQALTRLPFAQREAFVLQQEGFSLADIGRITDDHPETIKSRLRFARKTLKRYLEDHHG